MIGPLGCGALTCALVIWYQEWGYQQILMLVGGMSLIAIGIWVATGVRRILVEGEIVTAEYGGGRHRSWRLQDLYSRDHSKVLRTGVIRERRTGKVAFVVTQNLLGWEELLSLIDRTGAA